MKIITVDCNYVEPGVAAAYLIVHRGRGFFVECNTTHAIPLLEDAVIEAGLTVEDIDGLIITHIHLDHAGGAGKFLQRFPNAKLFAHPKAARHSIQPEKLVASATQVYGTEFMQKMYGEIVPCPADRVVTVEDGQKILWQQTGHWFETRHTLGHATHHLCVFEPKTETLFTGDSFGVHYSRLSNKYPGFALVSTSPTDFDGEQALAVVDWIESKPLKWIAPTHFGMIGASLIKGIAAQLRDQLRFSIAMVQRIEREGIEQMREERVAEYIREWLLQYYGQKGVALDPVDLKALDLDIRVNAQGLCFKAARGAR